MGAALVVSDGVPRVPVDRRGTGRSVPSAARSDRQGGQPGIFFVDPDSGRLSSGYPWTPAAASPLDPEPGSAQSVLHLLFTGLHDRIDGLVPEHGILRPLRRADTDTWPRY